jgi:hypothetical protein
MKQVYPLLNILDKDICDGRFGNTITLIVC